MELLKHCYISFVTRNRKISNYDEKGKNLITIMDIKNVKNQLASPIISQYGYCLKKSLIYSSNTFQC